MQEIMCSYKWKTHIIWLLKDGEAFVVDAHKGKENLSLINAHQGRKFISVKKFVFFILEKSKQA